MRRIFVTHRIVSALTAGNPTGLPLQPPPNPAKRVLRYCRREEAGGEFRLLGQAAGLRRARGTR